MCLYIGDIGDNRKWRDNISIYVVPEPDLSSQIINEEEETTTTKNWTVFHLKYPYDKKHNAESLLIDPNNRQLVIITKSTKHPYAQVFEIDLDVNLPDSTNTLKDTEIRLPMSDTTDASMSADGQVVIIRMYIGAYLWPRRGTNQKIPLIEILREKECRVNVGMQLQGEGIALNLLGTAYYIHSEKINQKVWKYEIITE
jgi:hypothetical protein